MYLRKAEIKNVIQYFCNKFSTQTIQKITENCSFNEFAWQNYHLTLQEILLFGLSCLYQSENRSLFSSTKIAKKKVWNTKSSSIP